MGRVYCLECVDKDEEIEALQLEVQELNKKVSRLELLEEDKKEIRKLIGRCKDCLAELRQIELEANLELCEVCGMPGTGGS